MPQPSTYVALLRGINVGGKNRVPMPELAQLFVEAGCSGVRTYINSGNVIFKATPAKAEKLPAVMAKRIAEVFALKVPVVIRTAAQFAEIVANNPYLKAGAPESALYVMFLSSLPEAASIAKLDPARSPGDLFALSGGNVYLHLTTGAADTKLTNAWFDSKLSCVSTGRNWRTVLKLHDLMQL